MPIKPFLNCYRPICFIVYLMKGQKRTSLSGWWKKEKKIYLQIMENLIQGSRIYKINWKAHYNLETDIKQKERIS